MSGLAGLLFVLWFALRATLGQELGDPNNVVSVGDWVSGPAQVAADLGARVGNVVSRGDWVTVADSTQPGWRQQFDVQGPL